MKRIVISALSGSTGKTLVTLGLIRAFSRRGLKVRAFKKGPDYIDTAWHELASGRFACNLDLFFMREQPLRDLFIRKMQAADDPARYSERILPKSGPGFSCEAGLDIRTGIQTGVRSGIRIGGGPCDLAIIEGNRGLFDGLDVQGSCSTASLAKALKAPVILLINTTKMTRTAAALVNGCANFEKDLKLAGVIANRTGGERHGKLLAECIQAHCAAPFLGCLPRLKVNPILERATGLAALDELPEIEQVLDDLAEFMEQHLDLDKILELAATGEPLTAAPQSPDSLTKRSEAGGRKPRIGYVHDSALWFIYQENLEALQQAGAEARALRLSDAADWPVLDGLYLPGGAAESFVNTIKNNPEAWAAMTHTLRRLSNAGLPIYAEGAGAWLTARELAFADASYPMSGIFPLRVMHGEQKRGLGYVRAEAQGGPFFAPGTTILGHEFNYTTWEPLSDNIPPTAYKILKGAGLHQARGPEGGYATDGFYIKNTQASATQLHALANPDWAVNFVHLARQYNMSAQLFQQRSLDFI